MSPTSRLPAIALALILLIPVVLPAEEALEIEFEKYTLSNGLEVILHEDHSLPMVSVNVWYHVGSKNERPGRTGFAHLFEHMMFQGSPNFDGEYFEPLQKIGGTLNGSTSNDRTNYWQNVPSNYVELPLAMESDRMGFLLDALTPEKLDVQIGVVQNERRQGVDNRPYGRANEVMLAMMYPADHPYSWTVIGSMADLSAASMEDVRAFFQQYYTPNNASLSITGDFDPEILKPMIERYFGTLPPGPEIDRPLRWVPQLDAVKRVVTEDDVELPRLYYVWHTPAWFAPGDAELDLLSTVLSAGTSSRLYKALVYDQQIAQDVAAFQASREIASTYTIRATARAGHTLEELEAAIDAELERLLAEGITADELEQAKIGFEVNFVQRLQNIGGFGGRANLLNQYNVILGSPDNLAWDMARYSQPTAESVMEVVRQYLDLNRRGILHVVPRGDWAAADIDVDRSVPPEPFAEPEFTPPAIQEATLDNGIRILLVEDHRLPLIDLTVVVNQGRNADPLDRFGLASITADLLTEGTTSRSAIDIANEAKALGAGLGSSAGADASFISLDVLKKNFDPALDLMADAILNPTFPDEELERLHQEYLGRIQQNSRRPRTQAHDAFFGVLYGSSHPYGQPSSGTGTPTSLAAITRDDVVSFYGTNYSPAISTVAMSGDITLNEAVTKLSAAFGGWQRPAPPERHLTSPESTSPTTIFLVDKPGAEQSYIIAGHLAMTYNNPDRLTFTVLNRPLGGQFTSRINLNLREDKGYTYGAQSLLMSRRGVAPFLARSPVEAEFTKESVFEIVKELTDINDSRPLSDEELTNAKAGMIKRFSQDFQNLNGITGRLMTLAQYDLPLDEWTTYTERVSAVTPEMAADVARRYLHADKLAVVVVGDRAEVEAKLKELNLGEVVVVE